MTTLRLSNNPVSLWIVLSLFAILLSAGRLAAQAARATPSTQHVNFPARVDLGPLPPQIELHGVSLHFRRTPAQEADLQALLAAQQDPKSPQYRQWLTPEEFADRFVISGPELANAQSWLEQRGFTIDSVARGRTMLRFSGTAAQIAAAFATELHAYAVTNPTGIETHFAPATLPAIPAELAGFVESVSNLDDFRPKPHLVRRPRPAFSGYDQTLFFAPADIALQYDIQPAYAAGFSGAGQSIAIVGQSQIALGDIEAFQTAASLPVKDPNLILVPNSGVAVSYAGDETESDLDLEWSGAIARDATITLVYTGSASNLGVFDSIEYAIDNRIANLIGISYGVCETALGSHSLEVFFAQAAAQGQTVVAASGDTGSTGCFGDSDLTEGQQQSLALDYPASSPHVTAVGGTEISQSNPAFETQGEGYWEKSNGTSDIVASLIQPVPEEAWNEDQTCASFANQGADPLCATGGGASALFARPAWQTGVPGIPAGNQRAVPDVALAAAIFNPGYLLCSSDQSAWQQNQVGSCSSGFRDAITGDLTAAGGTSFAAPIFAGMMAIVNQRQGYVTGSGPANPALYKLASDTSTYAFAFRDIATGGNQCDAGSSYCKGTIGFAAAPGYDQATGLGAIDLAHLAAAWPPNTAPPIVATTTIVSASSKTPALNAEDTFTIAVASVTGTTIPTGTVTIAVDANPPIPGNSLNAKGGFTYTTSFASEGAHEILVAYSGDATHAPSTGSAAIQIPVATTGGQSFSLNATNGTVNPGSSGTSTITVTPANGYTGTVNLTFSTGNSAALQSLCFEFTNGSNGAGSVTIAGPRPVNTQLKFIDMASDRSSNAALPSKKAGTPGHPPPLVRTAGSSAVIAALVSFGLLALGRRHFRASAAVVLACAGLAAAGLVVSCGGNRSSLVASPPTGKFTVTVTGQDSRSSGIPAANTTFQLTID